MTDEEALREILLSPAVDPALERSELAAEILDQIGRVEVDYRLGITDQSAFFVEDMLARLEEARARKITFQCSERQLRWLESIQEKLES